MRFLRRLLQRRRIWRSNYILFGFVMVIVMLIGKQQLSYLTSVNLHERLGDEGHMITAPWNVRNGRSNSSASPNSSLICNDVGPKALCDCSCQWKADPETKQFLKLTDDKFEMMLLHRSAYMALSDIASNKDDDHQAPILFPNHSHILSNCIQRGRQQEEEPRVWVIYFETTFPVTKHIKRDLAFLKNLSIPHVILTTNTPHRWKYPVEREAINHKYLLKWYGANQIHDDTTGDYSESVPHSRAFPLPIGLTDRYDPLQQSSFVADYLQKGPPVRKRRLLYINFAPMGGGNKAHYRKPPYDLFCSPNHTLQIGQTCTSGGFHNRFGPKPTLREWTRKARHLYRDWAKHKFTLSPRGNKPDCHRFWESLYVKSVPIVLKQDHYYHDLIRHYFPPNITLPILFVDAWENITQELLEREWTNTFQPLLYPQSSSSTWPPPYLTISHLRNIIQRDVHYEVKLRAKQDDNNGQESTPTIWQQLSRRLDEGHDIIWPRNRTRCYTQNW